MHQVDTGFSLFLHKCLVISYLNSGGVRLTLPHAPHSLCAVVCFLYKLMYVALFTMSLKEKKKIVKHKAKENNATEKLKIVQKFSYY